MLHIDVSGRGRTRLVLVHGFTQTGRSWRPLVPPLARRHQVVAVDCPGHGLSSHIEADLWSGAQKLGEVGNEAAYIGYSMGGRLALHLALAAPYLVRRLVLVGATAGLDDDAERAARVAADEELARGLERDGVELFVEQWLSGPLFATLPRDDADRAARMENTAAGLASALRLMGTGRQESLWDRLPEISVPALFVAGEADAKFSALAHRLAAAWGGPAAVGIIPDAGHACHLERPGAFLEIVVPFLEQDAAHDKTIPTASSAP
jgi:2-succinyl-6-hydroxy-2,4-cyclohexadiene-1-carboxylate synthase